MKIHWHYCLIGLEKLVNRSRAVVSLVCPVVEMKLAVGSHDDTEDASENGGKRGDLSYVGIVTERYSAHGSVYLGL